jgi:hypothetical protein
VVNSQSEEMTVHSAAYDIHQLDGTCCPIIYTTYCVADNLFHWLSDVMSLYANDRDMSGRPGTQRRFLPGFMRAQLLRSVPTDPRRW